MYSYRKVKSYIYYKHDIYTSPKVSYNSYYDNYTLYYIPYQEYAKYTEYKRVYNYNINYKYKSRKQSKNNTIFNYRQATREDRDKHNIPNDCCTFHWDPDEEPIFILGSVFSAVSLGKWIFDWTFHCYESNSEEVDIAEQLWYSLIDLLVRLKEAKNELNNNHSIDYKNILYDFVESGDNLKKKFNKIIYPCESCMLSAKNNTGIVDNVGGIKFITCMFLQYRDHIKRFIHLANLWTSRFKDNIL